MTTAQVRECFDVTTRECELLTQERVEFLAPDPVDPRAIACVRFLTVERNLKRLYENELKRRLELT